MNITEESSDGSAGVLLHISSLPGNYPCGDFGPEAYAFAKKLKQAKQKLLRGKATASTSPSMLR